MRTFTLIGSRQAPEEHNVELGAIALELLSLGLAGHSGGAPKGPDAAFTKALERYLISGGDVTTSRIYLPDYRFYEMRVGDFNGACINPLINIGLARNAYNMLMLVHKAMAFLPGNIKRLHCRNAFQILRDNLSDPVDFVIMSAPPAADIGVTGGTATGWKIANAFGVPIYNLQVPADVERLRLLMAAIRLDPINFDARIK